MALGSRIMRMESAQEVGEHIFSHPYNANSEEKKNELLDEAFLRLEQVLKARVVHENIKAALNSNPSREELRMAQHMLNQQPQWLQSPTFRMESSTPTIDNLRMRMEADENIFTRFWNWLKEIFNKIFGSSDSSSGGGSSPSTATETEAAARTYVQQQQAAGVEEIHLDPSSGVGKALLEISSNIPGKSILEVINLYIGDSLDDFKTQIDFLKELLTVLDGFSEEAGKLSDEEIKLRLKGTGTDSATQDAEFDSKINKLKEKTGEEITSLSMSFGAKFKRRYIYAAFGDNVTNLESKLKLKREEIRFVLFGPRKFKYSVPTFNDKGEPIPPENITVEMDQKEMKALFIPNSEFLTIATKVRDFASRKAKLDEEALKVLDDFKPDATVTDLKGVLRNEALGLLKGITDEVRATADNGKGASAVVASVLKAINEVSQGDILKAKDKRKQEADEAKRKAIQEALKPENFWTKDGSPDEEFKKFIQVVATNKEFRDNLSFALDKKGVEYLEQVKKEARKLYDALEEKDRIGKKANEAREAVKKDLVAKVKKIKEEENK